ncbi:hypothetical protein GVX82_00015 [Patescibacteria group bacterium]|jgi:uncharacterized protein YkwD|nr:hypothetical protein [Patescibacteria group bacterium]
MHLALYVLTALFLATSGALPEDVAAPAALSVVVPESAPSAAAEDHALRSLAHTDEREIRAERPAPVGTPTPEPAPERGSLGGGTPAPAQPEPVSKPVQSPVEPVVEQVLPERDAGAVRVSEILDHTNDERRARGLPPYALDPALTSMAEAKLADMIERDYFQHDAPTGEGVEELARDVGYDYLLVGENLAYGDFADARHVVDAWMESPGHRENILHERYQEIGIAVARAPFRGGEFWVAVQEFGLPQEACPAPDPELRARVDTQEAELAALQDELAAERARLEGLQSSTEAYYAAVEEFNDLVASYNELLRAQREDVGAYNEAAESYNDCLAEVAA